MATSATLAMADKARELRASGNSIIGLSLGEPDITIPDFVKHAAIDAINQDYHYYTPVDGYVELKAAIIEKFKRDNTLTYTPSQIVVSTGAKQTLYNLAQVLLNDGDEVLLPAPYWVSYNDIAKVAGGVPIEIKTSIENDFKVTPQALEAAITPKTKAIVPVHLFGMCANMEAIMQISSEHDLFVIEDNAQAIGATDTYKNGTKVKAGVIGHAASTSFFPSKNLGCYGDGGLSCIHI